MLTADYVAKNSTHVVVGIRGTNTASLASWANNLGFAFTTPSSTYFPGSPGKVHAGFYETFGDMRADVLNAVRTAVNGGTKQVLVVGHSLGAAVANIMSVYLQKQVTGATVTARLFAPPRVGNPDWANYVDATLGARSQWMAIYDDLVPHLPTLVMNFRHSGNEAWMLNTNAPTVWRTCTGQENKYCSDSVSDDGAARITSAHGGPYAGVNMGC
jgi:predicted lipase